MKRLVCLIVILVAAGSAGWSRVVVAYRLATPPMPVEAGQQFALCAANVGTTNADLKLQFISVRTGAVVATRDVTLPPPGPNGAMPDPCLTTTAEAVASAGNPPPGEQSLVVGIVVINRALFGRPSAATAAVQVTAADTAGGRRNVASVPLHMATMTNNRNTPIEIVH